MRPRCQLQTVSLTVTPIGAVLKLHVDRLDLFPDSREDAFKLAFLDRNQHLVTTNVAQAAWLNAQVYF
jgi:hypothetical protein